MRRFFRPFPLAVTAVVLLLLYTLAGFVLVPYAIKTFVLPSLSDKIKRPVLVREVECNPFALSLRLTGFEIQEADQSPLVGFNEFFINFQSISVIRRAYVFDTIRLAMPFVSVKVAKNGRVNLVDLIPPAETSVATTPEAPSVVPAVQIGHFEIAQGIVEFRDESKAKPFTVDIVPINIFLNNFHTRPGGDNAYAFVAELGKGETVAWEGTVSIDPIRSEGNLSLAGLKLPPLWQYMQERFRFSIASGTLAADGRYRLDASVSPPRLTVSNASLRIADLALAELGAFDPVITIPIFTLEGIQADLSERSISISAVNVANAVWTTWLNVDGTTNYQSLLAPVDRTIQASSSQPTQTSAPGAGEAKDKPWTVLVKQVGLNNHTVHFEDRRLTTVARTDITALTVHTEDVAVPLRGKLPLALGLTLNGSGQVKVDGQVSVNPFETDLALSLKNISLQPYQPYLERFTSALVESGVIDLDGVLHVALDHPKSALLTYRGNVGVKSLAIIDREEGKTVASWKQLQLQQIDLSVDPTAVTIDEVALEQPTVHAVIGSNGQLNLSQVARPAHRPTAALEAGLQTDVPTASPKKSAPLVVAIKTVKLLKGAATFQDDSIQPSVRTAIQDLTGTIKGLSSTHLARADVALSGKVDKVAPLKISGTINPLRKDALTDLTIKFENLDLTTATPYSGKYVGYPISRGKLFLNLAYKISQKHLEAENKLRVDQLTFGEKTNSPNATSLPVSLAVALLKDRKGVIDIDLPIRGDLNDPDFKYGKVVISTLVNLVTKLIASPFALLGNLIPGGGGGEDLQFFEFAPGSATSSGEELKKAEALTKALTERPGLRLEITGTADPVRDRQALGLQKLSSELLARWNRDRGKPPNAEPLPADEERRLIKELYERRHDKAGLSEPAPQPGGRTSPPTVDEMKLELVAAMPPDEEGLGALAHQRAEEIRNQLTGEGKLAGERVYLANEDITASDHEKIRSRLAITAAQ